MSTNARRGGSWGRTLAIIGALAVIAVGFLVLPPMLAPQPSPTPRPTVANATLSPSPTPSPPAEPSFALSPYVSVSWELHPGGIPTAWISPDGRAWSARYPAGANGLQIGSAAINQAGVLLSLEQMESTGPSTAIRFLRAGSDETADVDLPLSRPNLVALPERFLALGNCADTSSCAGLNLAIGLPVESE